MKDKFDRTPSLKTAREVLVEAFLEPWEEHVTHSVRAYGRHPGGGLQILCTCGGYVRVPWSDEMALALQNMRKLTPREFDAEMYKEGK